MKRTKQKVYNRRKYKGKFTLSIVCCCFYRCLITPNKEWSAQDINARKCQLFETNGMAPF
jgi:hypothetical protein